MSIATVPALALFDLCLTCHYSSIWSLLFCGPLAQIFLICFGQIAPTATAKSLQSCPTLCDPIDGSPPGSPVPGILQARTLERVAISFSNAWRWKVKVKSFSRVRLLATPWTAAYQVPPSMGFSRQEYWSGVKLSHLKSNFYPVHFWVQTFKLEKIHPNVPKGYPWTLWWWQYFFEKLNNFIILKLKEKMVKNYRLNS